MATSIDPARAVLITKEYRYRQVADAAIKARYPDARELTIDTNMGEASALALANEIFAQSRDVARTFTIPVAHTLFPDDFTVSPPRFTVTLSRHPAAGSVTYTVISAKIDHFTGQSALRVRG